MWRFRVHLHRRNERRLVAGEHSSLPQRRTCFWDKSAVFNSPIERQASPSADVKFAAILLGYSLMRDVHQQRGTVVASNEPRGPRCEAGQADLLQYRLVVCIKDDGELLALPPDSAQQLGPIGEQAVVEMQGVVFVFSGGKAADRPLTKSGVEREGNRLHITLPRAFVDKAIGPILPIRLSRFRTMRHLPQHTFCAASCLLGLE